MPEYKLKIIVEGDDKASGPLGNVAGSLQRIGEFAAGGLLAKGITAIGGGIAGTARQALTAYADFERLQMSLQTLTAREMLNAGSAGSMQEAYASAGPAVQDLIGWIEDLAVLSPFKQEDISNSFRLAMAYGFTTEEAQRLTTVMTDFASGSGATGDVMNRIALALGQIKSRGKLAGQEIMQLTEAGIPVRQILAEAFGVTTAELEEMQQAGISADAAIEAIISTLETDFAGAAEKQAGTFSGLISSLSDIKEIGLREFFAGTFQAVQPYLQAFVDTLTDPAVQQSVQALGQAFGDWIGTGLSQANESLQLFAATFKEMGGGAEGVFAGLDAVFDSPQWLADIQTGIAAAGEAYNSIVEIIQRVNAGIEAMQAFDANQWLATNVVAPVQEFLQPVTDTIAQVQAFFDKLSAIGDMMQLMGGPQALLGGIMPSFERPEWISELTGWHPQKPSWITDITTWVPATPEWLEALMAWAPAMPGWVGNLLDWAPSTPGWVTNLLNWTPHTPDWVSSILNWKPAAPGWVNALISVLGGGGGRGSGEGNALGTSYWRGGMTMVGEHGPELVNLPRGSRINNAFETQRMMAAGAQPVVVHVNVAQVSNDIDVQSMAYRVADVIQKRQRAYA